MLKFQSDYNITIKQFEDFILIVYVIVDDLYLQYAPDQVLKRRNISQAKLSDSEIITITICGELVGIDSENAWFSFVKKNYSYLFPNIGSRTRFNRTRRNLLQMMELLREKLLSVFSLPYSRYFVIDSFPLPVCKFGRAHFCKTFRGYGADYGKCSSKKRNLLWVKVHALITLEGFITDFEITPASVDDRIGLRDLTDEKSNITILGDKGYVGEELFEDMQKAHICLMALKRSNSKEQYPKNVRRLIFRLRRRVETVFSQLSEQLHAERVLAKSMRGLKTHLVNKILAYDLCMVINHLFGKTYDIQKIKQLIF